MAYYVRVRKLNGRNDFYQLGASLEVRGFGDNVEYCEGWHETTRRVLPHLRFLDEQDALAYVLAHGGECKREPPFYAINDCDA